MTIQQLKEKRAAAHAAMKDIRAKADPTTGELAPEYREGWDRYDKEYTSLTEQIRMAETEEQRERDQVAAEYEARQRTPANTSTTAPGSEGQMTYDQVFNRYLVRGRERMSADEQRLLETRGTSTQITTTDNLGGYLVPTSFSNQIEQEMAYFGPMLEVAETYNDTIGGTLEWPTGSDVSNVGAIQTTEAGTINVSDMAFGQVLFGAYTFTSEIVKVSRQLMQDERVGLLNGILTKSLGERIGRNVNAKLTTGTGTNEPYGVVTVAASGKEAASQTAFTKAELIDLAHSVDKAYRQGPKVGFMMHDTILAAARKLDVGNTDTVQIFAPSIIAGEPDRLLGYPVWVNNNMTGTQAQSAKIVLFGNFSKYVIRRVAGLSIERTDHLYFANLAVGFLGWLRLDANLIAPNTIKYLQNKTT